jgi:hypothetical protein
MKTKILYLGDSRYRIGIDHDCLVISAGISDDSPKIWLCRNALKWLAKHGESVIASQSWKEIL